MVRKFSRPFRWGVYAGSISLFLGIGGYLFAKWCIWSTAPENLGCILFWGPIFPGLPLVAILQEWGFLSNDDTLVFLVSLLGSVIEVFLLGVIIGWVVGKFKRRPNLPVIQSEEKDA